MIAAVIVAAPAGPLAATVGDSFAYALKMTPEEGPVDPAIQRRFSPQWRTCQETARTTIDTIACYEAEFARQDTALNRAWRDAVRRIPAAAHQRLVSAQRTWIAARDPFCRRFAGTSGSLVPVAFLDCRVEQTIRRTIWLERRGSNA